MSPSLGQLKLVRRAAVELYKRPFLLSPARWFAAALLAAAVGLGSVELAPPRALQIEAACAVVAAFATFLGNHCRALRDGDRPLVVLSAFCSESAAGTDLAATHTTALRWHLESTLGDEVCLLLAPCVSASVADRITRNLQALLVVHGEIATAGHYTQLRTTLTFPSQPNDAALGLFEHTMIRSETRLHRAERRRLNKLVPKPEVIIEAAVLVEQLVAASVDLDSFAAVQAATELLLAEKQVSEASPSNPVQIVIPDAPATWPAELRGRRVQLEALARRAAGEQPSEILQWALARCRATGVNASTWFWLQSVALTGCYEGWAAVQMQLAIAQEAAALFPSSTEALCNLGNAYVLDENLAEASQVTQALEVIDPDSTWLTLLRGAIAAHGGNYAEALDQYRRIKASPRRDQYLGDCLAALGQSGPALFAYRSAIRGEPMRTAAIEGARALYQGWLAQENPFPRWIRAIERPVIGPLLRPLFERRLRYLLRHRGELDGLHSSVAHVALLRGDFVRASKFGTYAMTLTGHHVRVMVDVTMALTALRQPEQVDQVLVGLTHHLDWLRNEVGVEVDTKSVRDRVKRMCASKRLRGVPGIQDLENRLLHLLS